MRSPSSCLIVAEITYGHSGRIKSRQYQDFEGNLLIVQQFDFSFFPVAAQTSTSFMRPREPGLRSARFPRADVEDLRGFMHLDEPMSRIADEAAEETSRRHIISRSADIYQGRDKMQLGRLTFPHQPLSNDKKTEKMSTSDHSEITQSTLQYLRLAIFLSRKFS
jgi:hypothetical protein